MGIITTKVTGHVLVTDAVSGCVLLDKLNAVHNQNMAMAIARGLAHQPSAPIFKIKLGNGGSAVNGSNEITYLAPNVVGASATLYNATYEEVVDDNAAGTPSDNQVTVAPVPASTNHLVIVTATIAAGQPAGQDISDSAPSTNPEAQYAFDELGLFTEDNYMLSHIIFSPILKTANRELVITYTLTVSVS